MIQAEVEKRKLVQSLRSSRRRALRAEWNITLRYQPQYVRQLARSVEKSGTFVASLLRSRFEKALLTKRAAGQHGGPWQERLVSLEDLYDSW
jgi:hypothetical protein